MHHGFELCPKKLQVIAEQRKEAASNRKCDNLNGDVLKITPGVFIYAVVLSMAVGAGVTFLVVRLIAEVSGR